MKFKIVVLLLLLMCGWDENLFAYGTDVHQKLNDKAVGLSQLEGFLTNILQMPKGVRTGFANFNNRNIQEWIMYGGEQEDDHYNLYKDYLGSNHLLFFGLPQTTRGFNHFLNPLWLWEDAYFSDPMLERAFFSINLRHPFSTVLWALENRENETPPQQADPNLYAKTGDWSWNQARNYYYLSLTNATDNQENWANCFRGIGQIMHTIQDMSLPEHTRNDGHPEGGYYEHYVNEKYDETNGDDVTFLDQFLPIPPSEELLTDPRPQRGCESFCPISGLYDRNVYNGSAIPFADAAIGLAEYSNANFFSKDTIFNGQPHPSKDDIFAVSPWHVREMNFGSELIYRMYLGKDVGEPMQFLAAETLLFKYLERKPNPLYVLNTRALQLDDACYYEYAQKLIPRAIGYSARALNYFFRGKLEISAPEHFLYGIIDGAAPVQQFTKIRATVTNVTPGEVAGPGIIEAVARYRLRTDYQNNMSSDPPDITDRLDYNNYSVSAPVVIETLGSEQFEEFEFDFSFSPIPAGITDLYLFVVFRGTLGLEKKSAIAVGSIDLKEPTHLNIFNTHDLVYFEYQLLTIDDIKENPDLLAKVDLEQTNGEPCDPGEPIICPMDIYTILKLFPSSGPVPEFFQAIWTALPPGRYGRIIYLTDSDTLRTQFIGDRNFYDYHVRYTGSTTYQETPILGGVDWYTDPPDEFRGVKMRQGIGFAACYPQDADYCEGYRDAPWWAHPMIDSSPYPASQIRLAPEQ